MNTLDIINKKGISPLRASVLYQLEIEGNGIDDKQLKEAQFGVIYRNTKESILREFHISAEPLHKNDTISDIIRKTTMTKMEKEALNSIVFSQM